MNTKTIRKMIAMLMALAFVFGVGGISALADETEQVCVSDQNPEAETNMTVDGSITVEAEYGQQIAAVANATQGGDVSLEVREDVSAKSEEGYAHGAEVYALGEDSSVEMSIGGDLTAESEDGRAVGAETFAGNGGEATLTVGGDVSTTGEHVSAHNFAADGAIGVGSRNEGSVATAEVEGNVTATATGEGAFSLGVGVEAETGGTSELTIGGDLTSTADEKQDNTTAYGANVTAVEGTADLSVGGDVTAEGDVAISLFANAGFYHVFDEDSQSYHDDIKGNSVVTVDVGGDVTAKAEDPACGFSIKSCGDGSVVQASVGGSITAESEDDWGRANGVIMEVYGAEANLDVKGDITASADLGNGVWVDLHSYEETAGLATVQVGGDLSGQETGLYVKLYGEKDLSVADVTVEGTLSAKSEEGTAVVISENVTADNLKLTVWKIDLDRDGDAVKQETGWTGDGRLIAESTEASRAIEASIEYIIKVEPTQADLFAGTQTTAKAGENVAVKLTVPAGYQLNGAFTDEGKSVELLKDDNGNYYVVVPKGGGIYLSASLEALPTETQATPLSSGQGNTETAEVGYTEPVRMENGSYVLTLSAKMRSFTFIRNTLEQLAKKNDVLVIHTEKGSCNLPIAELLNLNEKAVNFRFALTDEAVEIYLDGQLMKTIGLSDFV